MPRRYVVFSDLSGSMVADEDLATIVIKQFPGVDDLPVQIEADAKEVKPLLTDSTEYIVAEVTKGDHTRSIVVDLATFQSVCTIDPYTVVMNAKRVKVGRSSNGTKTNGNTQAKRAWCRENGWPDIKDKGKLPADAEAAYLAAHPAA